MNEEREKVRESSESNAIVAELADAVESERRRLELLEKDVGLQQRTVRSLQDVWGSERENASNATARFSEALHAWEDSQASLSDRIVVLEGSMKRRAEEFETLSARIREESQRRNEREMLSRESIQRENSSKQKEIEQIQLLDDKLQSVNEKARASDEQVREISHGLQTLSLNVDGKVREQQRIIDRLSTEMQSLTGKSFSLDENTLKKQLSEVETRLQQRLQEDKDSVGSVLVSLRPMSVFFPCLILKAPEFCRIEVCN